MDVAKASMGGIWFPPMEQPSPLTMQYPLKAQLQEPLLWRPQFPQVIQDKLMSSDNPAGSITNSDLDLAGSIAHDDVLVQALLPNIAQVTTRSFSDNNPAVS